VTSFGTSLLPEIVYVGTPEIHVTLLEQPTLKNPSLPTLPVRVAQQDDWRITEIVEALERSGLGRGNTACLVSFHPYFDIGAFKHTLLTRRDGIDMPSTDLDDICNRLSQCDAVIWKDGGQELLGEEPYKKTIVRPMYACFERQLPFLSHAADFQLPDGSAARLYFKTIYTSASNSS